jgi:hypothetical protein
METLWLRLGDCAEYESFGTNEEGALADTNFVEALIEANVGKVDHWLQYGLVTENFQGSNYISIYWGDENADALKSLDDAEKEYIENALIEYYEEEKYPNS